MKYLSSIDITIAFGKIRIMDNLYMLPQDYLTDIKESGGNSIRVWLFTYGDFIPLWDEGTGFVLGTDSAGTLIEEGVAGLRSAYCLPQGVATN